MRVLRVAVENKRWDLVAHTMVWPRPTCFQTEIDPGPVLELQIYVA